MEKWCTVRRDHLQVIIACVEPQLLKPCVFKLTAHYFFTWEIDESNKFCMFHIPGSTANYHLNETASSLKELTELEKKTQQIYLQRYYMKQAAA